MIEPAGSSVIRDPVDEPGEPLDFAGRCDVARELRMAASNKRWCHHLCQVVQKKL
jgi:hypothetical protein